MDLGSIPRETLAVALALALAVAVIQALSHAARRWHRSRRMAVRMQRALRGEARAPRWLEDHGYAVVGAQVVVEHPVQIDDRIVVAVLRADYLAEKDGARYVVEVKTGLLAPRIETSATRRQLLEYRVAFDVDGIVLVDADSGTVHEVTFPSLARVARGREPGAWRIPALALALAAALVVALIARFD